MAHSEVAFECSGLSEASICDDLPFDQFIAAPALHTYTQVRVDALWMPSRGPEPEPCFWRYANDSTLNAPGCPLSQVWVRGRTLRQSELE